MQQKPQGVDLSPAGFGAEKAGTYMIGPQRFATGA
jgi:hypothetical protein